MVLENHHEHGIDRGPRFDEVWRALEIPPQPNRKGDPMTKSTTMKSAALALALMIAGLAQASAQNGPSMQEKMACRADAEAFCAQHIGKPQDMRACLEQNKAKLSTPCRQVVEAHGG
jgi:hypothetical protein